MITFENVRWKNFLSTGNSFTEIPLNQSPSTLMIGRNGAGKSTILDALCFGLFNKPFRKINKPQLVNSINEKDCLVEIEFSISNTPYRVVRGIKPSRFEVYKNNLLLDQEAATKDTQNYLEKTILKLNYKSFTQVVILGSSTFVPFMQLPAAHRREVIEDLLDIGIFTNMNIILKDRVKSLQQRQTDCQHLLKFCSERVLMQKKNIDNLAQINDDRMLEKSNKFAFNKDEVLKLQNSRNDIQNKIDNINSNRIDRKSITDKLDKLKDVRARVSQKKSIVLNELKFFSDNHVCPTCTQEITPEFSLHKQETLTAKKDEYTSGIEQMTSDIDSIFADIENYDNLSKTVHELRSDFASKEREIIRLSLENLELETEIRNLQMNHPNLIAEEDSLHKLLDEQNVVKHDCSMVDKEFDEYKVISNLLKDTGIKSRILKKYIPVFNQLINKYLHSMDFFVNFTLDENFEEKIMSRFRDDFSYSSFSEGEKQKIDLALLFTWREIARMKNSVSTNLLILDEVFDSSLDENGTQELLKILRNLGNDANMVVISHKGEILIDKFLTTIIFEKVNDFSKMKYDG